MQECVLPRFVNVRESGRVSAQVARGLRVAKLPDGRDAEMRLVFVPRERKR